MMAPAERNAAAIRRAERDGLRTSLHRGGDFLLVYRPIARRSHPAEARRVRAYGVGEYLVIRCDCPFGAQVENPAVGPGLGLLGCKHGAAAARRLRRAHLVFLDGDGLWKLTEKGRSGPRVADLTQWLAGATEHAAQTIRSQRREAS